MTTTLWWTLTLFLMLVGVIGTVVPLLPGTTIILGAAILHHFMLGEAHSVGWWTLAGLGVLTVLSFVLDIVSGSLGAKWFGATRWGAVGGILGAIVGVFFFPLGLFLGPMIGVLLGKNARRQGIAPGRQIDLGHTARDDGRDDREARRRRADGRVVPRRGARALTTSNSPRPRPSRCVRL